MTKNYTRQRLLDLAQERGIFRASEAEAAGVHPQYLSRLLAQGILERVARGCYRLTETDTTEHHTLAVVATAVPSAVICLLSALQFHQIGTQTPLGVWIALERGTRKPQLDYPPLRVVYFSGEAFALGVESHIIEGQTVRVYSVAKTIADCFKHRNKLGLDVALEALTDAWRQRRLSLSELNIFAQANRVQRVLQPYVEVLIQ
jgi:predicted transcriptional regulator of viral defense system